MSKDRDDDVDTSGARDSDAAVPTGKAGRGDTTVASRVRTDADKPEDTRASRANPFQYIAQVAEDEASADVALAVTCGGAKVFGKAIVTVAVGV